MKIELGNYNKNAFTLVELLVVIAIVGILSSLIIIGMNSSIQSATIAKAQIFSASLRDSLLGSIVAEWKFEDSTNLGKDSWGNNNCSNTGTPVQSTSGCMYGNCLSFNGTANYLDCGNPTSLQMTGDQTIEMWLYPTDLTARRNPYNKAYGGEGTITQETDGRFNYYYGTSGANTNPYQGVVTNSRVQTGKWYHLVLTRSLSTSPMTLKWYINGILDASYTANYSAATVSTMDLLIGYGYTSSYYGKIDDVRLYSSAIPSSLIKEQYYAGLNQLLSVGEINKAEYENRIK